MMTQGQGQRPNVNRAAEIEGYYVSMLVMFMSYHLSGVLVSCFDVVLWCNSITELFALCPACK